MTEEYDIERTVIYDDSLKSKILYYLRRFSKHALSLVLTALVVYLLGDNRFIALVPVVEILQKLLKEKGLWY